MRDFKKKLLHGSSPAETEDKPLAPLPKPKAASPEVEKKQETAHEFLEPPTAVRPPSSPKASQPSVASLSEEQLQALRVGFESSLDRTAGRLVARRFRKWTILFSLIVLLQLGVLGFLGVRLIARGGGGGVPAPPAAGNPALPESSNVKLTSASFTEEMERLVRDTRAKADTATKIWESASTFVQVVVRARNDDRQAFEELLAISRDRNDRYQGTAKEAVNALYLELGGEKNPAADPSSLPEGVPAAPGDFEAFKTLYGRTIPLYRPFLLDQMQNASKITVYQKLSFLMEVTRRDTSLRALAAACRIVDKTAGLNRPFIAYESYLEWWERSQPALKQRSGDDKP